MFTVAFSNIEETVDNITLRILAIQDKVLDVKENRLVAVFVRHCLPRV